MTRKMVLTIVHRCHHRPTRKAVQSLPRIEKPIFGHTEFGRHEPQPERNWHVQLLLLLLPRFRGNIFGPRRTSYVLEPQRSRCVDQRLRDVPGSTKPRWVIQIICKKKEKKKKENTESIRRGSIIHHQWTSFLHYSFFSFRTNAVQFTVPR